ncbi:electron transfer flavoprotein subunit alpha/FixB family protein [Marinomonas rhizomae]|uniref:Electron transfer flavoprotein subunit alpha n=1 Tax=Marinomonas rhizomae TaxID=491948 RepID=A0A366JAT6_9GAMM|nr:FAD-binding protein [Marinomonas rhizomae]RBP83394.1 electron transfer flavoprotein alpha subunit apoprotein [Marinomonas rhizomae]RNF73950.1 electron transfer flavoprotein subunit alpha/FixB family protein [Marinomonas rhizomae]
MTTLLIAEHNSSVLSSSTLSALTAAQAIGNDIHVLVAGKNIESIADAAANLTSVSKVLCANADIYEYALAEPMGDLIVHLSAGYSHIVAPSNSESKDFMPRVSALLDVGQVSDICAVLSADQFKRPIYAGNAIATVTVLDDKKVITVRASSFGKNTQKNEQACAVERIDFVAESGLSSWQSDDITESMRPDLASASRIVSGGRGVGSGDNFALVEALADKLGAAVGASRAAVDAGFVSNDLQVGQTGKIVAPDLYMAFGISGAIQHLAGMKDSNVIVAVNKDEDAPIFQVADYGLVGDLFSVLPEMTNKL